MPLPNLISVTTGDYIGGTSGTVSVNFDASCTLVVIFALQTRDPTAPTGQAITIDGSSTGVVSIDNVSNSGDAIIYAWYKLNPGLSGAKTIAETHTNNATQRLLVYQFKDNDSNAPIGTEAEATGADAAPTVNATLSGNSLCIDAMIAATSTRTATVGSGQTEKVNVGSDVKRYCSSTEQGSVFTTMSWTLSGASTWAIMALPINGKSGGVGVTITPYMML